MRSIRRLRVVSVLTLSVGLAVTVSAQASPGRFVRGFAFASHRAPWAPLARQGSSSAAGLPSKASQIQTLESAEQSINADVSTNGAGNAYFDAVRLADLQSYNVESLWNKGIDGAGTTVAVIEGWDDPNINSVIDTWDSMECVPVWTPSV
jgi:hypothetical protein